MRTLALCLALVGVLAVPALAALPGGRDAVSSADYVVDAAGAPLAGADASPEPMPRRLVLALAPSVEVCLSCALANGRRLGSLGRGSRLDDLNRRFGVRSARPLLRAHARGLEPERPAEARARWLATGARFPARAQRAAAGAVPPDLSRTYVLELRRHPDLAAVARAYAADPAVAWCEPDRVVRTALLPNDFFLATQGSWGQPFADLWGLHRIAVAAAWDVSRGAGVLVAIVDTGIDYNHPDLAANVWTNPGEIAANGLDDDGNGYVDDVRGWDFADGDADPIDDYGHGTHVAGTVAAVGGNGTGVVGVAYESRVMAVRGLGTGGFGYETDLAEAILYAVDNGADVINASWGGTGAMQVVSDAIATAHAAGVVFVAAAGNSGVDLAGFFPAADPNAIAVGAVAHDDTRAYFSNFGSGLDVVAPGGGDDPPPSFEPQRSILSTLSGALNASNGYPAQQVLQQGGARYLRQAGTSMAAPHVAGTAALVLAAQPMLSVEQVRQVLRTTAVDLGPAGPDAAIGFGRIDAAAAVVAAPPLAAHLTAPTGTVVGATDIEVRGTANGPGFASYSLAYRAADDSEGWITFAGPTATPVDDGALGSWDVSGVADGAYVLRVRVERPGETFVDDTTVVLKNAVIDTPEQLAAVHGAGMLEIRGTAAGGGFTSYRVDYRRVAIDGNAWVTTGLTPSTPVTTPARNGLLATLDIDALGLAAGDRFDFRLTVENGAGTTVVTRSGIAIDPTLRPGWPQPVAPVPYRDYLSVADLDGDAIQEILVGSGDEVVIFEPDGSVRPGWPQSVATATTPLAITRASPLVADVAGDAAPEVIATNTAEIFVWSGDGTLLPGFPAPVTTCRSGNHWLRAGDLDGDGKDEIICTGIFGIEAVHGDGSSVTGWRVASDSPYNKWSQPPAVADVLGDSRVELAWYHSKRVSSPQSLTRGTIRLVGPDAVPLLPKGKNSRGTVFTHPGMADMDGDRHLDMVLLTEHWRWRDKPSVAAFDIFGKKIPLRKAKVGRPERSSNGLASYADLDRDGRAEAYVYSARAPGGNFLDEIGAFLVFQHKAVPEPAPIEHELFTYVDAGGGRAGIAIGDIDGDGVQELVGGVSGRGCGVDPCVLQNYSFFPVRRAVAAQRPDGTLVPTFPKPVPEVVFSDGDYAGGIGITAFLDDPRHATPAIADLDGDGLKEVIWYDLDLSLIFVWNVAGTPGPLLADWPMYHHDPKHSNALPPTLP